MYYWIILLLYLLNANPSVAGYRQQEQRERNESERVSAQGTRGCPFPQGELYLHSSSNKSLTVNPLRPQIWLHVNPPEHSQQIEQTVKISLINFETKETKFLQTFQVQGKSKLSITPNINLDVPHILTAGLICNPQRPSTTKSLRILVVPDDKK